MLAIRKVEMIDLSEDEIRRKEEAMARLIFTAAQRKLRNRHSPLRLVKHLRRKGLNGNVDGEEK